MFIPSIHFNDTGFSVFIPSHLHQRYRVLSVYPFSSTSTIRSSRCLFLLIFKSRQHYAVLSVYLFSSTLMKQSSQCLSLVIYINDTGFSVFIPSHLHQRHRLLSVYSFSSTSTIQGSQCLSLLIYINDTEFSALQPTYEVLVLLARLYQQNRVLQSFSVCNNHVGFCLVHTGLWALRGSALSFSFINCTGFCISNFVYQQCGVLYLPSHLSTIRGSLSPFSFINNTGFCSSLLIYQQYGILHIRSHLSTHASHTSVFSFMSMACTGFCTYDLPISRHLHRVLYRSPFFVNDTAGVLCLSS